MPITVNENGDKRTGEFVWLDLVTSNGELNATFLKELLGWTIKDN